MPKEKDIADQHWLSNKAFIIILAAILPLVFSSGMLWKEISSLPNITEEQWNDTYVYAKEAPKRKSNYANVITGFEKEQITQDSRILVLENHYKDMKTELKSIQELLRKIDKKIQ